MEETAFVSVAFGDKRYIEQQKRLNFSILNIYPNAKIYSWTDEMPPISRSMSESLYGFKPWAVRVAMINGYRRVMFFDPAIVLTDKIDYYDSIVSQYGVLAAQDDNKLHRFCSDKAIKYYGYTRDDIMDWHLVGGSFYYFDFTSDLGQRIFDSWILAEQNGLFGSQKEQASGQLDHGHRNDEAMMALALYAHGSKPLTGDVRYNCDGGITKKYHFK